MLNLLVTESWHVPGYDNKIIANNFASGNKHVPRTRDGLTATASCEHVAKIRNRSSYGRGSKINTTPFCILPAGSLVSPLSKQSSDLI